ncbi:MAG: hypothetical protein KAG89_18390 [Fulvimarina manganoxydans]|uniref:hypothetical protein n=1 Tax=Fulvimarina manganoxydans TaxID=937218 RepID=UPI002354A80A|nr:hypothetical protein [Fulvimarina manganoxydans]MCK5934132.1 hypothetical protein [Fulvimarina manganoxydans]
MTRLEKIERDIAALSENELARFREWFKAYEAERFDKAIERDARSGALDALSDAALAEFAAGRVRPI